MVAAVVLFYNCDVVLAPEKPLILRSSIKLSKVKLMRAKISKLGKKMEGAREFNEEVKISTDFQSYHSPLIFRW